MQYKCNDLVYLVLTQSKHSDTKYKVHLLEYTILLSKLGNKLQ